MYLTVNLILAAFISSILAADPAELERKLTATLNPECPNYICDDKDRNITVIHIRADSESDTIHYVWDFTGKPAVLVALTSKTSKFEMSWEDFFDGKPESVRFTERPKYAFLAVINKIWQFNDAEGKGLFPPENSSQILGYETNNYTWTRSNFLNSDDAVVVEVSAAKNFYFKLKSFSGKDHGFEYPHLLHSSNSTQIDLVLRNITTKFESPRLGFEMILVASEKQDKDFSFLINERKSLDDEHTPGIFEIIDILSPETVKAASGGYVQYRPVSYTHPQRDVSTSTETHLKTPVFIDSPTSVLKNTLAYSYFGQQLDNLLVQGVNMSFGSSSDGFYTKTNYTTMTFLLGYGVPPSEVLSAFVIVVASIGLGVPLVLLLFGGGYICVKRLRNRSSN